MKKTMLALVLALCVLMAGACGKAPAAEPAGTAEPTKQETVEENAVSSEEQNEDAAVDEAQADESEDDNAELEALGDVDVDEGLFSVELTFPAQFVEGVTQEDLDESVKTNGYKSATLNADGSVTYVMTKAQHKEMLDAMAESIRGSLQEMIGSENYPNITDLTANDNFTSFTITTKNTEPDLAESVALLALYTYGGMYAVFSGEEVDNIHVDYVNADSGEVISSADSSELEGE